MSWANPRIAVRLILVLTLSALTAGCFQPMYAERADGKPALREKLTAVTVPPIALANGSRTARLGVEIRNSLMFKLYGEGSGAPPIYSLVLRPTTTRSSLILDPNTSLAQIENFGIDVNYVLTEVATGKVVLTGSTFSRVSYDIPGSVQRFARARAYRDAEDRACQEIAENLQTRLASFFYSGI